MIDTSRSTIDVACLVAWTFGISIYAYGLPPSRERDALNASRFGWYGLSLPMTEVCLRWKESDVGFEKTSDEIVSVESLMWFCDMRENPT